MSDELVNAASQARQRAQARYSNFMVGAVVESIDGRVFTGCNIENSSYGLTVCAERVALFKAVSDGYREFKRMCVVADTRVPTPPCGACRQVIWELCGDIPIILANLAGDTQTVRASDLLPHPFDRSFL